MVDRTTKNQIIGGSMTLKPIQDVIIIRPGTVSDTTAGGIVIPQKSMLKTCEGVVIAVGPGIRNRRTGELTRTDLKPGDCVQFEPGRGIRMDYLGDKLLVMREPDVTGVLSELQGATYDPTPYYEQSEIRVGAVV
jgi:chaperonin GroES